MTTIATSSIRDDPACADVTLLSAEQVAELFGVSKRSIWRLAACDEIPRPLRLTPKLTRWRRSDLLEFVERKSRAAR